jgi:ribosomal protein S18 acetylase RimI-like enzyme
MYLAFDQDRVLVAAMVLDEIQTANWVEANWTVTGPVMAVHRLMVDPTNQGRRIGDDLMGFAEEHARAAGYRAIRLDAFSENPRALALYRKRGYRDVGCVTHPKGVFRCFEKPLVTTP